MSEIKNNELDALQSALLGPSFDVNSDEVIAVKAEDVQQGGGIDFSKHYFEPRVGETYLIKLLPNPGGELITHRSVYKSLPDPERKGKTFHYISSGNAKTCPALELFFELNAKKKEGDAVAEKKIEKYLSRTNQGCVKVQILQSPKAEEVGMIRMMSFATFGPNATVANLINLKMNPTKDQIKQGYEREDIFNLFESSVMSLVCEEATYDGIKGRDFTKSSWAPKKRGAIAIKEDGTTREFKATDIKDGKLTAETKEWFEAFLKNFNNPDYDIFRYFAYKEVGDPRMDKETADYVKSVWDKVNEIIPVIRDKSLAEIANYGKKEVKTEGKDGDGKKSGTNVLAESVPDELAGSVMAAAGDSEKKKAAAPADDEVADILNS
jgi:hypothetical protein